MIDIHVAQLMLTERKVAYFITDHTLKLVDCGGYLQLFWQTQQSAFVTTPSNGNDAAHLCGHSIIDLIPELYGQETTLHALLRGELPLLRLEFINREDRQGDLVYLSLTLYPHHSQDAANPGLLCLLEDVTVVGRTTQRLTQQHNELYLLHRRLNEANLQLTAANTELRALDELKSRFISIAAHELRTPIATMLGYMDFMLDDDQDQLSTSQRQYLHIVQRSTKRLLTITTDLLDVTRLEAGRLELAMESVNLANLVGAVLTEFQPEAAKKQLAVTLHVPTDLPPALCDEKRTIQIFANLISNAIKYTPDQGAVTVDLQRANRFVMPTTTVTATTTGPNLFMAQDRAQQSPTDPSDHAEEHATMLVAKVTDTGIGIPPTDLMHIGKAFYRASNAHVARASGTGLGLHITQSLCELQGGSLWLESKEGEGTTAFVAIPVDDGLFTAIQSYTAAEVDQ